MIKKEQVYLQVEQAFSTFGIGASLLPFFTGGEEPEEVVEEGFDVTPGTITNIVDQARRQRSKFKLSYHKNNL